MIVWAKLSTGKVYHGWERKWKVQRFYNSLCGLWRARWQLGGYPMTRKCKICKRMEGYHNKRPPRT